MNETALVLGYNQNTPDIAAMVQNSYHAVLYLLVELSPLLLFVSIVLIIYNVYAWSIKQKPSQKKIIGAYNPNFSSQHRKELNKHAFVNVVSFILFLLGGVPIILWQYLLPPGFK